MLAAELETDNTVYANEDSYHTAPININTVPIPEGTSYHTYLRAKG